MTKFKLSIIFIFMFLLGVIKCYGQESSININAEYMEYDENKKVINAKQNVKISSGNFVISGNNMEYNIDAEYLIMTDSVTLTDENYFFTSEKVVYDLIRSTGDIYNGYGFIEPFYFNSKLINREKHNYKLKNLEMSTCELNPPHYTMRVSNAELIPNEIIHIHNISCWLGKIPFPFFYLPYYPWSLKKRHDCWWITPGLRGDTIVAKVIYGFPVTNNSYAKIYFDNLSRQGIGTGIEYNYRSENKYKGTLYTYQIKDEIEKKQRWNFFAAHQQKLSPIWLLQGNIELLSDEYFYAYYFTESWFPVMNRPNMNIGVTRQTDKTNLRISAYTVYSSTYLIKEYSLPKIEYTLLQPIKPKFCPVSLMFSTVLSNNYNETVNDTVLESLSDLNAYREIKFTDKDTITPRIGIKETFRFKNKLQNENISLTKSYLNLNYLHMLSLVSEINFSYNITNRYRPNTMIIDSESDDYGIETNALSVTFFSLPSNETNLRINTGYDLRNLRSAPDVDWKTKISPVSTEFNFSRDKYGFYIRDSHRISPFIQDSFQIMFNYTVDVKTYFDIGLNYIGQNINTTGLTNSFAFWPSNKWHIDISHYAIIDKNKIDIKQREINIYRDLHCWEAKLTVRTRILSGVSIDEYYLNLGLKTGREGRKKLYKIEHEKEFYPWRKPE